MTAEEVAEEYEGRICGNGKVIFCRLLLVTPPQDLTMSTRQSMLQEMMQLTNSTLQPQQQQLPLSKKIITQIEGPNYILVAAKHAL